MKICAGIITYNPDINLLKKNIESIYKQVEKIIIIDNCSNNIEKIEKNICNFSSIDLIKNQKNCGIARALNQMCSHGLEMNFDAILTLDQDSICPENLIEDMKKYLIDDVAVVAPNIIYRNNEDYAENSNGIKQVEWVITSASLVNLKAWDKIRFDDKLFIDGVDRDFCIRANHINYKVLKDYNVGLLHQLGNLKCKKIFNKIIYVTNHNEKRYYYMSRNAIYLDRKLNEKNSNRFIRKSIIKILLFEKYKIKKIIMIIKGVKAGKQMIVEDKI